MTTDFSKKVEILGEFYQNFRDDENLKDFIEFNDLGLPLAFLTSEGLCEVSDEGTQYINETWNLFIAALEVEDTGFTDLEQIFNKAQ